MLKTACETAAVRWTALFADLEAQWAQAEAEELAAEVADRTRREIARLRLYDRGRTALGVVLTVRLGGVGPVRGRLDGVGPDWMLLTEPGGSELLVASGQLIWLSGLPPYADEPDREGVVDSRWTFAFALRALARDRSPAAVLLGDGSVLTGTFDRVGADYAEIAAHPLDEPRRDRVVRALRTVPLAAISAVRTG
jgi:hypothetical protein